MSRIGRKPIAVPKGVNVTVHADAVEVKGPKGTLKQRVPPGIKFEVKGAELIVLPTNWPVGVEFHPELFAPARANENHCYVLAADRVGTERGTTFMGRSLLVDYDGKVLAEAGRDAELLTDLRGSP